MKLKNRDEWLNEGHSYDKELDNARMMKSSASELVQWAQRKIAESRPENFKEGVINPVQEKEVDETLILPVNEKPKSKGKAVDKKMWNKMKDDDKLDLLLTVFSDPDEAEEHVEDKWEDLPPVATSNMVIYEKSDYDSYKDADDIFFLWDDIVGDDRKGIEHGNVGGMGGSFSGSQFAFDDSAKGFKKFLKELKKMLKKQGWKHEFMGDDVLNIMEESVSEGLKPREVDTISMLADDVANRISELHPYNEWKRLDDDTKKEFIADAIDDVGDRHSRDRKLLNLVNKKYDDILNYIKDQLSESINENIKDAAFNLDKIFPEDEESIMQFQDIEDNGTVEDMIEYIEVHGNDDMLRRYGIRNDRDVKKLAKHIMRESVNEARKLTAKEFAKWKQEREYIKQMADNNTSSVYKIADYVQFLGLFTERQWEMFMYGRYEKDLQKTDPKTKNKIYKVLQRMFESTINEATMKGKYAGNKLKSAEAGKTLTMDGKTYTALGKGKWKGPDGEKLSWVEVSSMASALGDKEVTYEAEVNEAKMDKRFQKDWEKSCAALINHLEYELRTKRLGADKGIVEEMVHHLKVVQQYPKLMSHIFGTNESVNEADWSDDVKTKWTPPKGLFAETTPPNKIADTLFKASKDLDQAMSRLMFYINRAGKLLSPKAKANLETAKKLLQKKYD